MSATLAHPPHREQIPAAGLLLRTVRRWSTRKQKNTIVVFPFGFFFLARLARLSNDANRLICSRAWRVLIYSGSGNA
jgi:hypothetical protein